MVLMMGSLSRSGKVRNQTPLVAKSSDSSYRGGCTKFKQKSSTNRHYSSGAHRLDKTFGKELNEYNNEPSSYRKNDQGEGADWVEERAMKRSEPTLTNSSHKYNTERGFDRLEWLRVKAIEKTDKKFYRNVWNYRDGRNHKKWHRNHPVDGFYQKRTIIDDLTKEF